MHGIIKKICIINHWPMLTTYDSPFDGGVWVLKDEMLVAEKEIGGRQIPYIPKRETLMNVDDWSLVICPQQEEEEVDEVGNRRLIIWLTIVQIN